jgi:NAD(P)-dependent dehydrogenase (short-subunit alcohol dehydrogenase family)
MNKTVLITGPTGVIGKATALELAKNNCRLILFGRNETKLNKVKSDISLTTGNNEIEVVVADLSEPGSIRKAVSGIRDKYSSLNALVNVAAIFKSQRFENSQGNEYMFATNHLGPFVLTNELLGLLKAGKPSRIITVTAPSTTKINFEDLNGTKKFSAGFMGSFGASKMMNIVFTYELSKRLEGTGVTATAFHPGLVKSSLTDEMPAFLNFIIKRISGGPEKAAKMLCNLAIDSQYANSNGKFYKFDGKEIKSSQYSYDRAIQEKLWKISEQLSQSVYSSAV